jgi:1,4-alpha-glucan branching enzyme
MKWDMGWMHDTLEYMSKDPIHRKYSHNKLTFRMLYAFNENFVLPLSHDEVVHGKGSLIRNMPGDEWQKFANLRLLFGYMFAQPGKKLLFMGNEIGQWNEWYHETSLDWNLLDFPLHKGTQQWVKDLNSIYKEETALYELDCNPAGFEWIDCDDSQQSVISLRRKGSSEHDSIIIACNFTPVPRHDFKLGVNNNSSWKELLNSDAIEYGGSGQGNLGLVNTVHEPYRGNPYSISITLPPLAVVYFKGKED